MSSSHEGLDNVYDALLQRRIVFIRESLDHAAATLVIAQCVHLEHADPSAEITLHIKCEHADLQAALSVYDTMQAIEPDVRTLCVGVAGGGAALLLAGGATGKRGALPAARIALQDPAGQLQGRAGEIDVRLRGLLRLRQQVNELLARHSGQPVERIERDAERGHWLSAEDARAYGLIDAVVSSTAWGSAG